MSIAHGSLVEHAENRTRVLALQDIGQCINLAIKIISGCIAAAGVAAAIAGLCILAANPVSGALLLVGGTMLAAFSIFKSCSNSCSSNHRVQPNSNEVEAQEPGYGYEACYS